MSRDLMLLRHGKAEWDNPQGDAARVLTDVGLAECAAAGQWLTQHQVCPDYTLCSSAQRTQQTWQQIQQTAQCVNTTVQYEAQLYLADVAMLLSWLARVPSSAQRVMLVGHNPGIEALAVYLADRPLSRNTIGEIMATANLVHLRLPDVWQTLAKGVGEVLNFYRPQFY